MGSHFKNLLVHLPNLGSYKILDIGSGLGKFIIESSVAGANVVGLEKNDEYIRKSHKMAGSAGVKIKVFKGEAESLPFDNDCFEFINLSEVIEHVNNPEKVILEIYRVLKKSGDAYISVPSRFSVRDPHFHLYFVNLLPRFMSDFYISLFFKHKDYSNASAGHQRLKDMNYYKFNEIKNKFNESGFMVVDIREKRIKGWFNNKIILLFILFFYRLIRPFYFNTFHFLLKK